VLFPSPEHHRKFQERITNQEELNLFRAATRNAIISVANTGRVSSR